MTIPAGGLAPQDTPGHPLPPVFTPPSAVGADVGAAVAALPGVIQAPVPVSVEVHDEPGKHAAPDVPAPAAAQTVEIKVMPQPAAVAPADTTAKETKGTKAMVSYLGTSLTGLLVGLGAYFPEEGTTKAILGLLALFVGAAATGVTTYWVPNTEKK